MLLPEIEMSEKVNSKTQAVNRVLVVGGGIAGMQASLDLAEMGIKVSLLEKNNHVGGILNHLDKQFPTDHCGMCRILPIPSNDPDSQFCLRRGLRHPDIDIITNAEVEGIRGKAGRFEVSIKKRGNYIDVYKCIGCSRCVEVCPVLQDEQKVNKPDSQKVIHAVSQLNIPYVLVIEQETCTKCGECVKVCPTDAIVIQPREEIFNLTFGAVIHSGGFKEFDCTKLNKYGYNGFKNVITGLELESLMAEESGNPLVEKVPEKIGFIQCVGSRNAQLDLNYCSSVCCMYAMKEAIMLKSKYPESEIYIFYIDLKIFGKNHYQYFEKAKHEGIKFIRCIPSIDEIPETKNLVLTYENGDGSMVRDEFSLIVLSTGLSPPEDVVSLNKTFGIKLNKYGFCDTHGVNTSMKGNYVCGCFGEPKDIENSIIEASAAAFNASRVLGAIGNLPSGKEKTLPIHESSTEKPRIGIFVCGCRGEISQNIDITDVVNFSRDLTNVYDIEVVDCLCFDSVLNEVKEKIRQSKANRLIFAACAIHSYRESFEKAIGEIGLTISHLETIDLREHVAWVNHNKKEATQKAKDLLAMAIRKINQVMPEVYLPYTQKIEHRVAVIGAGITGMTVSSCVAEMGFHVDLIEKTDKLGGVCTNLSDTLEGMNIQEILDETMKKIENNKLIHIHNESEIIKIEGDPGNFCIHLKDSQGTDREIWSDAIVVATGAQEYEPTEYLYGKDKRVITQLELEKMLIDQSTSQQFDYSTIVMIQCVGSFSERHPYCSRFCCNQAIKNAMKIKKIDSNIEVFIFFQEMMTYGFKEEYYTKARDAGVIFVRYPHAEPPNVVISNNILEIKVHDTNLHEDLLLNPDLIVLSNGFAPNLKEGARLAEILGISLHDDGFFEELDPKFRPLDSTKYGIFICGSAHSPRTVIECITQAQAVAMKVLTFISSQKKAITFTKTKPFVDEDLCCGCGQCVLVCHNGARSINGQKRISEVSHILCQGCGLCSAVCPNGATKIPSLTQVQIMAMVEANLSHE